MTFSGFNTVFIRLQIETNSRGNSKEENIFCLKSFMRNTQEKGLLNILKNRGKKAIRRLVFLMVIILVRFSPVK